MLILPGLFSSVLERQKAYERYFKLIEPVNKFGEKSDAEVLSRFHIFAKDKCYHIAKPVRRGTLGS